MKSNTQSFKVGDKVVRVGEVDSWNKDVMQVGGIYTISDGPDYRNQIILRELDNHKWMAEKFQLHKQSIIKAILDAV